MLQAEEKSCSVLLDSMFALLEQSQLKLRDGDAGSSEDTFLEPKTCHGGTRVSETLQ